jgi:hypothetical protein
MRTAAREFRAAARKHLRAWKNLEGILRRSLQAVNPRGRPLSLTHDLTGLPVPRALLRRWLSDGRPRGGIEYVAPNPTRPDQALGSLQINVATEMER